MHFQWCQKWRSRCKIWESYKRRSWVRKQRRRQTAAGGSVRAGPRSADQTYREGKIYIYICVYDHLLCFGSVNMSPQLACCKIKRVEFDVWTLTCTCQPWGPTPAHQTEGRPCRWTATLQPGCSYHTPGWTASWRGMEKGDTDSLRSLRNVKLLDLSILCWCFPEKRQSSCSHSLHRNITMQCWQWMTHSLLHSYSSLLTCPVKWSCSYILTRPLSMWPCTSTGRASIN